MPPLTVASLATIIVWWPCTTPIPVTNPAAGAQSPFSTASIEVLKAAPWPGNHAQLDGVVTNLAQTVTGEIGSEHVHALQAPSAA